MARDALRTTGILPGVTVDEILDLAIANIGIDWTINGCTDFVWGITNLAGAPFFDLRDLTTAADPTQPLDTLYVVPHSDGIKSSTDNVAGDGWASVFSGTSATDLAAILQPGDVVRVYASGNAAEDSVSSGGGYVAHSFIVVSVEGGDIQVVDNWNTAGIIQHSLLDITNAFAPSGEFEAAFVSRLDENFTASNFDNTITGNGYGDFTDILVPAVAEPIPFESIVALLGMEILFPKRDDRETSAAFKDIGDANGDGKIDYILDVSETKINYSDLSSIVSLNRYLFSGQTYDFASIKTVDAESFSSVSFATGDLVDDPFNQDPAAYDGFPRLFTPIGDVNGDQFTDVLITNQYSREAKIVFGDEDLADNFSIALNGSDSASIPIDGALSLSAIPVGDFNGDGFSDVAFSSFFTGRSFVISMGSGTYTDSINLLDPGIFDIDDSGTGLDLLSLQSAGDVNGDGFDDVIISGMDFSINAGKSFVLFGSSSAGGKTADLAALTSDQGFEVLGRLASTFGLGGVGDLNGDGFDDILFAGEDDLYEPNEKSLTVRFGDINGLVVPTVPSLEIVGFGYAREFSAGDLDGDGFDDLIFTGVASGANNESIFIIFGDQVMPTRIDLQDIPAGIGLDVDLGGASVTSLELAEDINGDGLSDLLVTTSDARAFVLSGSQGWRSLTPSSPNSPPEAIGGDVLLTTGASIPLASLFGWSDPDGLDDIVSFALRDRTDGSGYLTLDGVRQTDGILFDEQPIGEIDRWAFVAGAAGEIDEIGFNAIDAAGAFNTPSALATVTANSAPNGSAPVVAGPTFIDLETAGSGGLTSIAFDSSVIDVSDVDRDVSYIRFYDTTPGEDGGFLALDGVRITGTFQDVALSGLGRMSYVAGPNAGFNDIAIEAFDAEGNDSNDLLVRINVTEPSTNSPPSLEFIPSKLVSDGETFIVDITATDAEDSEGDGLVYSISGGADAARIAVDPDTGVVSFIDPVDFDTPTDAGANNVYDVEVTVTDSGGKSATRGFNIFVEQDTEVETSFLTSALELAAAAYSTDAGGPDLVLARNSGWTPLTIPGVGQFNTIENQTAANIENTVSFYESNVDGERTLAIAFSGTEPELSALTDLINQIGFWSDIYSAQRPTIEGALDWAFGAPEVSGRFDKAVVVGHSLGGILSEYLLSDGELLGAYETSNERPLSEELYGVTFGSPGSPEAPVNPENLVQFVSIGDPVALLHSDDFFGYTSESNRIALDLAELASFALGAAGNLAEEAFNQAGNSIAPARDGTTITVADVPSINFLSGGAPQLSHFISGSVGYRNVINDVSAAYDTGLRGFDQLQFWLDQPSPGTWVLTDPTISDFELTIVGAQALGIATLDFFALPTFRALVGVTSGGASIVSDLLTGDDIKLSFLGTGIDRTIETLEELGGSVVGTVSGFFENLSTTIEVVKPEYLITYKGVEFSRSSLSPEEGSAILNIDIDLDGEVDIVTKVPGDFDLDRFFVLKGVNETSILYTENSYVAGSEGTNILIGTDGSDTLDAQDGYDYIFALAGGDLVLPGLGKDVITLGAGEDLVRGRYEELLGDLIVDFAPRDKIEFVDVNFDERSLTVTYGSAILDIDVDLDGITDATVTLLGNFEGSEFRVSQQDGNTLITVLFPPDAADDVFTVNEDTVLAGNVLADNGNGADEDPDNDPLSVVLVSGPSNGSLVLGVGGTFSYTPDINFNGTDSFEYSIEDPEGGFDTAEVNITIDPVNDAPLALDDTADVLEDGAVSIDVLANDSDPDGDETLTIVKATSVSGSAVTLSDGMLIYSADADIYDLLETGEEVTDQISYTIEDDFGEQSIAMVTVSVTGTPDGEIIFGTKKKDDLTGTGGEDTIYAQNAKDIVHAGDGADTVYGGNGNDKLFGQGSIDTLYGENGDDYLNGGGGNDFLFGGRGNDTLRGGPGDDELTGGKGEDVFVFALGEGTDTVFDFGVGNDLFGLQGLTYEDLEFGQMDCNATISSDGELLAVVIGVDSFDFTAADFVFVA